MGSKIIKRTVSAQKVRPKITTHIIRHNHYVSCSTIAWTFTLWGLTECTVRSVLLFLDALTACIVHLIIFLPNREA